MSIRERHENGRGEYSYSFQSLVALRYDLYRIDKLMLIGRKENRTEMFHRMTGR